MPESWLSRADRIRLLTALANAFHTAERIALVLDDIGFDYANRPLVTGDISTVWREVLHQLEQGAIPDGIHSLLAVALDRYPANLAFADLARRYAPDLVTTDSGGTSTTQTGSSFTSDPVGHVFISYVREDSAQVDRLQQELEAAGIRVWRDTAELWPGEDWRVKIRRAITDDALVFLACFSRRSLAREKSYQNAELVMAIEQMRLRNPDRPWLIPVRFDDCEIPDLDLGMGRSLSSIQHADLLDSRFGDGMTRLLTAISRILAR